MIPGKAKYSVTVIRGLDVLALPSTPSEDWRPAQTLADERDITRIFQVFMEELTAERGEISGPFPLTFVPIDWQHKVRVYFDPKDNNSLHYVVADKDTGDDYAVSIRLPKPFNVSKWDRRDRRSFLR